MYQLTHRCTVQPVHIYTCIYVTILHNVVLMMGVTGRDKGVMDKGVTGRDKGVTDKGVSGRDEGVTDTGVTDMTGKYHWVT